MPEDRPVRLAGVVCCHFCGYELATVHEEHGKRFLLVESVDGMETKIIRCVFLCPTCLHSQNWEAGKS